MPPAGGPPAQNRTPLFVALGALGAAAIVLLVVLLASGGDDDPQETGNQTDTTNTPTTDDETVELPEVTPDDGGGDTGGAPPSGDVELEVTDQVVTEYWDELQDSNMSTYAFYLTNPSDQVVENLQVNVSLKDAAGTILGTDTITIGAIGPGAKFGVAENDFPPGATTVDVQPAAVTDFGNAADFGEITASNVAVGYDDYGMATFTFTATSTFSQQVDSPVVYVLLRDAAGNLVGGFNDYSSSFIPANNASSIEIDSLWAVPENDANKAEFFFDPGYL